jgi:uncharacterized protein YbbC (DUF1343 family)
MISGKGWDIGALASRFNALRIPGVRAVPKHYETDDGSAYDGVYLQMDPRNAGNLTAISYQAIQVLQETVEGFEPFAHTDFDQRNMFDKCTGTSRVRAQLEDGVPVSHIVRSWNSGVSSWAVERLPFLIYGQHPSTVVSDAPGQ